MGRDIAVDLEVTDMDWGMANRMAQLIQADGRCMFLPVDHGYFQGPTRSLEQPGKTIAPLKPYADALFATRGVVRSVVDPADSCPLSSGSPAAPAWPQATWPTRA